MRKLSRFHCQISICFRNRQSQNSHFRRLTRRARAFMHGWYHFFFCRLFLPRSSCIQRNGKRVCFMTDENIRTAQIRVFHAKIEKMFDNKEHEKRQQSEAKLFQRFSPQNVRMVGWKKKTLFYTSSFILSTTKQKSAYVGAHAVK